MRVRLIGYWRDRDDHRWPDPRDLIDKSWRNPERERVAVYFEHGSIPWAFGGVSECRLCGKPNGSAEFTDGVYLWPEGLAHYVREHSVKPPEEVINHIRRRYDEAESLDPAGDWSTEYEDRVFWPEGAELPADALAYFERHPDEIETLVVDFDWWRTVTSA